MEVIRMSVQTHKKGIHGKVQAHRGVIHSFTVDRKAGGHCSFPSLLLKNGKEVKELKYLKASGKMAASIGTGEAVTLYIHGLDIVAMRESDGTLVDNVKETFMMNRIKAAFFSVLLMSVGIGFLLLPLVLLFPSTRKNHKDVLEDAADHEAYLRSLRGVQQAEAA